MDNKKYSDILCYRPRLNKKKVIRTTYKPVTKSKIAYSRTVDSFENNLPSVCIAMLDSIINSHEVQLRNNDTFVSKEINTLKQLEVNHLIELKEFYSKSLYGENIERFDLREVDYMYIDKVKTFEENGEHTKVNYYAMQYDAMISHCLNRYISNSNKYLCNLDAVICLIKSNSSKSIREFMARKEEEAVGIYLDSKNSTLDIYKNNVIKKALSNCINNRCNNINTINAYYECEPNQPVLSSMLGDDRSSIHERDKEAFEQLLKAIKHCDTKKMNSLEHIDKVNTIKNILN